MRRRRRESGGGWGERKRVGGGELEVGEETVGPFAGGADGERRELSGWSYREREGSREANAETRGFESFHESWSSKP